MKNTDCPVFTVNNAVNFVAVSVVPVVDPTANNGEQLATFLNGDCFTILSAGFILPEAFTAWRNKADYVAPKLSLPRILIYLKGVTTGFYYSLNVFAADNVFVPLENLETGLDVFVDVTQLLSNTIPPHLLNENFTIQLSVQPFNVSMIGAPGVLNGKVLTVLPFIKVAHNFPLV